MFFQEDDSYDGRSQESDSSERQSDINAVIPVLHVVGLASNGVCLKNGIKSRIQEDIT